jgi:hypothetical protein
VAVDLANRRGGALGEGAWGKKIYKKHGCLYGKSDDLGGILIGIVAILIGIVTILIGIVMILIGIVMILIRKSDDLRAILIRKVRFVSAREKNMQRIKAQTITNGLN